MKDYRQLEAEEELHRKCARAQHERDIAVLAAEKTTAIAEAKLKAIEQSIVDERMSVVFEETELARGHEIPHTKLGQRTGGR